MARTYKRDSRGRFAGGGGGSGGGRKSSGGGNAAGAGDGRRGPRGGKVGTKAEQARAKKEQAARSAKFRGKSTAGRGAKAAYKTAQGEARKAAKAPVRASKVDLTDTGFTRRLGRAKALLRRAKAAYEARGSSIYDTAARRRVATLQSAVDTLSYARKTVRNNTVPASNIKTTDRTIIDSYNKQLAATKRRAASTPLGGRSTTAPKLTRSAKAAATRAKNKAAKEAEQRRRWEQSRRYG